MNKFNRIFRLTAIVAAMLFASSALADTAAEIDRDADAAIKVFQESIGGADVFLGQSAGYLIFPRVIKAGFVIGGETGEGALRIGGQTVDYYRTSAGSFGLQAGAQARSMVIAFMTPEALEKFRNSSGWKAGVDGSIALIDMGGGKSIDTHNIKDPVVGFIFGSKGLMANLSFEGSKFSKLDKSE